jgi:ABC-type antimicrobial peptide transport system permease subunit
VLSYSVSQRTKEIGLRMALGASGGNTVAMIVRSSVAMVAFGGVIGFLAALLLARSMAGILYGVEPFDIASFALATVVLLFAGVVASLLPALRSTRVDPLVALREQ